METDGQYYTVSVYLRSETDARAAAVAFEGRGVRAVPASIETYCLD